MSNPLPVDNKFVSWILTNAPITSMIFFIVWLAWTTGQYDGRIDNHEVRITNLEERVVSIDKRLLVVETKLDILTEKVDKLDEKFDRLIEELRKNRK